MYIIHLKPGQTKSLPERIDEWGWSQKKGFRSVDRHEIVKHKSIEELNAQLVSLVGEDGAQLLVGAFRSRRSISGPELAG